MKVNVYRMLRSRTNGRALLIRQSCIAWQVSEQEAKEIRSREEALGNTVSFV